MIYYQRTYKVLINVTKAAAPKLRIEFSTKNMKVLRNGLPLRVYNIVYVYDQATL